MAKKNSTKTATKEALQASEPRVLVYNRWGGINLDSAPNAWVSYPDMQLLEDEQLEQTDQQVNQLVIQNNVELASNGSLEVRRGEVQYILAPDDTQFTGVAYLRGNMLYAAAYNADGNEVIYMCNMGIAEPEWQAITVYMWVNGAWSDTLDSSATVNVPGYHWTQFYSYVVNEEERFIAMCSWDEDAKADVYGTVYTAPLNVLTTQATPVLYGGRYVSPVDLGLEWNIEAIGDISVSDPSDEDYQSTVYIYAALQTDYGQSEFTDAQYMHLKVGPSRWYQSGEDAGMYIKINITSLDASTLGISAINFYCTLDESTNPIWIARYKPDYETGTYYDTEWTLPVSVDWLGAMSNTDEWAGANLLPTRTGNSTMPPPCQYINQCDQRLYFWGDPYKPWRLWIGGNAGSELCCDRGMGGGYTDAEPGYGTEIKAVHKFKTASGASIVTVLCNNLNTNLRKRFNLIETQISIDSSLMEQSWMLEEITNVIGSSSRYGSGVWKDGMYVLGRYGLTVTTNAMEYNTQLESTIVSQNISPVFEDNPAVMFDDARMIYINGVIYFILGSPNVADKIESPEDWTYKEDYQTQVNELDDIIFCYDIDKKAYYTYVPCPIADEHPLHLMNIDAPNMAEGLGLVYPSEIRLLPTSGLTRDIQTSRDGDTEITRITPTSLVRTGEISGNVPVTNMLYIAQLEFRWDYFCGDVEIEIDGVDYYGRHVRVVATESQTEQVNDLVTWVRVNLYLENYHITIRSTGYNQATYRLTHIISKVYQQSAKIGMPYGWDYREYYKDGSDNEMTWRYVDATTTRIPAYDEDDADKIRYTARVNNVDSPGARVDKTAYIVGVQDDTVVAYAVANPVIWHEIPSGWDEDLTVLDSYALYHYPTIWYWVYQSRYGDRVPEWENLDLFLTNYDAHGYKYDHSNGKMLDGYNDLRQAIVT